MSMLMPAFFASSDMFKAKTMGMLSFLICNNSDNCRSICELLSKTMAKSKGLFARKCRTTCSSSEKPCKSYMPGKSTNSAMWPPNSTFALIKSTVMPGQLPTRADAPLMRLNKVDLPVLGMPNKAMRFIGWSASCSARVCGLLRCHAG